MSFWSGNEIIRRQEIDTLVRPFSSDNIDCAAYTLSLGGHAFTTTDDGDRAAALTAGKTPGEWLLQNKDSVTIQPGQFAFLLTEEVVTVPNDAIAFISVKAGKKLEGLVNVSGFHVDPGWSSQLIFGVFNAGSKPLVARRGDKLFLLFFASLEAADDLHTYKEKGRYSNIPAQFIQNMSGAVPSLYKLDKHARDMKSDFDGLRFRLTIVQLLAGTAITIALGVVAMIVAKLDFPLQDRQSIQQIVSEELATLGVAQATTEAPPESASTQPIVVQTEPPDLPVATQASEAENPPE